MPFVYFMGAVEPGGIRRVKIGTAADPLFRMATLQPACPYPLTIIATTPGSSALERTLHRHLAAHRIHGEWFHYSEEIQAVIRSFEYSSAPALQAAPTVRERLRFYIATSHGTVASFCDRAGVDQCYLNRILAGRNPGKNMRAKIELASQGKITAADWDHPIASSSAAVDSTCANSGASTKG